MSETPIIIAIDGPAGSGKSTLARRLADHYGLRFLDTGLLYRAVARRLVDLGVNPADEDSATDAARCLVAEDLESPQLRGEGIGKCASIAAALPRVRETLLAVQRRMAGEGAGSVVAGRDIGSVILPDAQAKLFVTASLEQRARRRYEELQKRGDAPIHAHVLDELKERDRRDAERAVAPMVVAEDAAVVDTSELDIDAAFELVRSLVDEKLGRSS